jgi:hypothetical protein
VGAVIGHTECLARPEITSSDVVVRTERHVSAPLGDVLTMMDIDAGMYYLLDDVAATVWAQLAQPTAVQDLVVALQRRYDVSADQCQSDVIPFLTQLHEKGLVRVQA